jgi:hypothetical protein
VTRFGEHVAEQLATLRARGMPFYHAFAFATIRQCGSSSELAAAYLRWLDAQLPGDYGRAASAFDAISASMKALILKGARAVNSQKPVDFSELFADAAKNWDEGMTLLQRAV